MSKIELSGVDLGDLPETQGLDAECLQVVEQKFKVGTKSLADPAASTASPDKIDEIYNMKEVVTHGQVRAYIKGLKIPREVVPVPPGSVPTPVPTPTPPSTPPVPVEMMPAGFDLVTPPSPLQAGEYRIVSPSNTPKGPVKATVRIPETFSSPASSAAWPDGTTLSVTQNPYGDAAAPFLNPAAGGGVFVFKPFF
nr:MAG TPA: hypothetical protein [Caudoviricetes sp.]